MGEMGRTTKFRLLEICLNRSHAIPVHPEAPNGIQSAGNCDFYETVAIEQLELFLAQADQTLALKFGQ